MLLLIPWHILLKACKVVILLMQFPGERMTCALAGRAGAELPAAGEAGSSWGGNCDHRGRAEGG